ncbi:Ankyrin_repeat protein 1 [Hexamita inflata]|uniref:Ankyrin repeat protein 1 n=1 Tax=Hexamita inflata TaxID=28002 RepID=A0AA86NPC7_9EUKA|nr:Ankyrin repeat protein 1 [Hexamita inflata]
MQFPGWFQAAAANEHTTITQYFHVSARSTDKNGWTALMHAAFNGATSIVQILCKKEQCMQTNQGYTALMLATIKNQIEVIKMLLPFEACQATKQDTYDFPSGTTALLIAMSLNHEEAVEILFNAESRASGVSPLHLSAVRRDYENVLYQQSIMTQMDKLQRTPLFYVCIGKYSEEQVLTYKALLQLTPKSEPDIYGLYPIHYSAMWNNLSLTYIMSQERVFSEFFSKQTDYQKKIQNQLGLRQPPVLFSKLTKRPTWMQFGTGLTPLHLACCFKGMNVVQKMSLQYLKHESSLSVTALMLSVIYDSYDRTLQIEQEIKTSQPLLGIPSGASCFDFTNKYGSMNTSKQVNMNRLDPLQISEFERQMQFGAPSSKKMSKRSSSSLRLVAESSEKGSDLNASELNVDNQSYGFSGNNQFSYQTGIMQSHITGIGASALSYIEKEKEPEPVNRPIHHKMVKKPSTPNHRFIEDTQRILDGKERICESYVDHKSPSVNLENNAVQNVQNDIQSTQEGQLQVLITENALLKKQIQQQSSNKSQSEELYKLKTENAQLKFKVTEEELRQLKAVEQREANMNFERENSEMKQEILMLTQENTRKDEEIAVLRALLMDKEHMIERQTLEIHEQLSSNRKLEKQIDELEGLVQKLNE